MVRVRLTLVCVPCRARVCIHGPCARTRARAAASMQIELIWRYFDADWWFFALRVSRGCAQCTLRAGRLSVAPLRGHGRRRGNDTCARAQGSGSGALPLPATSAPGLGLPRPHLHRAWAHPCPQGRVALHVHERYLRLCLAWTGAQRIWLTRCSRLCVGCGSLRYRRG